MLFATMLVDALHPALKYRKETLDGVCCDKAPFFVAHIFFFVVVDGCMASELTARSPICLPAIGHQRALGVGMRPEGAAEFVGRRAVDRHRARLAAALDKGEDRN